MSDKYSKNLIKEYQYWSVYIRENQDYLGRCIIWCKRENAQDLSEATPEEQKELFSILKELKEAVTKAFQPDWFNYSFLGNGTPHLHCQFVPRYSKSKEFMGVIFEDKLWGHNYKTNHDFKISDEVFRAIQGKIKEEIV